MKLLTKVKEIDAAIANIHTVGQSLQQDMHLVACSVIQHYAKHNDKRVVLKLLLAMPESSRVNALREWMNAFGTMEIGEKDVITTSPLKKLKLAAAIEKPFWKFSPEKAYTPIKIETYVDDQIKKLRKDAENTGRNHDVLIRALQATKLPAGISVEATPKAPIAVPANSPAVTADPLAI